MSSDQPVDPQFSLPIVSYPMCAAKMRLASAEPNATDPKLRITFDCECGFEKQKTEHNTHKNVRDHL